MTMLPKWKTCLKCHQMYSWNPDVGEIRCPRCHPIVGIDIGRLLFEHKKNKTVSEKANNNKHS